MGKVSQYCKTFIGRFNQNTHNLNTSHNGASISGTGTIIYMRKRGGFFSIRDDANNDYYLINMAAFLSQVKDRQRIHFCLEPMGSIANVERCGQTARLLTLNVIN